ncbi:MAG: putative sulfate exporter family transporter [Polyangiales bacterium]
MSAASLTAPLPAVPAARIARVVVPVVAVATLLPWVSSGVALLAGVGVALTLGNPWPARSRALAHQALTWSVVGLGAGMNLAVVGRVGLHGLGYTAVGIATALVLGTLLGRKLRVARDTSLLVTVGTAICGGSAIAAVAPAIRAKDHDVSMALVTVFLLNAIALFIFPAIGHHLRLGQDQFGLWCALAIHDTSSVVGAAAQYGERALEVATAAKLARALWIVPVTFAIAMHRARTVDAGASSSSKPKMPWFIGGFLAVAALVTFVPALRGAGHLVSAGAHRLLAVTLFLMGLGLSRAALRALGFRPLVQAVALWFVLAGTTLAAIVFGVIS